MYSLLPHDPHLPQRVEDVVAATKLDTLMGALATCVDEKHDIKQVQKAYLNLRVAGTNLDTLRYQDELVAIIWKISERRTPGHAYAIKQRQSDAAIIINNTQAVATGPHTLPKTLHTYTNHVLTHKYTKQQKFFLETLNTTMWQTGKYIGELLKDPDIKHHDPTRRRLAANIGIHQLTHTNLDETTLHTLLAVRHTYVDKTSDIIDAVTTATKEQP